MPPVPDVDDPVPPDDPEVELPERDDFEPELRFLPIVPEESVALPGPLIDPEPVPDVLPLMPDPVLLPPVPPLMPEPLPDPLAPPLAPPLDCA